LTTYLSRGNCSKQNVIAHGRLVRLSGVDIPKQKLRLDATIQPKRADFLSISKRDIVHHSPDSWRGGQADASAHVKGTRCGVSVVAARKTTARDKGASATASHQPTAPPGTLLAFMIEPMNLP
jgi:hypothetical protein